MTALRRRKPKPLDFAKWPCLRGVRVIRQKGYLSPRSIAILVILIIVLIVPLWWLRDGAKRKDAELAAEKAANQGTPTVAVIAPTEVNDPNAFGMTWGSMANDQLPASAVWMSCHGEPKEGISQPHAGSCNPYKGDASCRLALPVLCIKQDGGAADAAILAEMDKGAIQDGWAAGTVASSAPVAGFVMGSLAGANARCEKELGAGWRMASFHDGSGGRPGWGLTAQRSAQLDARLRHWVYINDQPGNCWNNKG
jgi:hypothetical protein